MLEWIFLEETYNQWAENEHPELPDYEVLAWDGKDSYVFGKLEMTHNGNTRDEMYVTCSTSYACLSPVLAYAKVNKPVKPKQP